MASLMIHTPENFITDWDQVNKSSAVKFHSTNEIGQTGVESMPIFFRNDKKLNYFLVVHFLEG